MRKHEGFTPCEGAGRIRPQARDRRVQGRTAAPSARHHLFRKANVHRREPQVPQEQPVHREFQVYRESQGCRESQALIIRGGHARNRVVFINTGREHGKRGPPPESLGTTDLALCLRVAHGRQVREPGGSWRALRGPSRSLPLMKTSRFLAGAPLFFLPRKFADAGKVLARASGRKRAEQRRAGESAVDWAAHQS